MTSEQLQEIKNWHSDGTVAKTHVTMLLAEIDRLTRELATMRTHIYREVCDPLLAENARLREALKLFETEEEEKL